MALRPEQKLPPAKKLTKRTSKEAKAPVWLALLAARKRQDTAKKNS